MKKAVIKLGICILNCVYAVMKLPPQKCRVIILSRQSNKPSLDIELLSDELRRRGIECIVLCKKLESGMLGTMEYIPHLFKQMKYLATSKVAVLDGYCIPACLLKKRKGLTIIQMWHALGSMKKFGKSILDMPEGKSSEIATLMKMHEGYDYIFTSSKTSRPAFAEAFGYPEEKLTIMSLPRVDALLSSERSKWQKEAILSFYPQLKKRKTIIYAPTLRVGKNVQDAVMDLIKSLDSRKYNLVIKAHPVSRINSIGNLPENVIIDDMFQTIEMLSIADFAITDYSAITYEIALKGIPLFFYTFDKEEYMKDRSFYLDYDSEMPGPICLTAEEVAKEITRKNSASKYKRQALAFADKYIDKKENCTSEIVDLIEQEL